MTKVKVLLSVLFLLVFGSFASIVSATDAATSQRWVCLTAERTGGHQALVQAKEGDLSQRPLPNAETFVVECLTGGNTKGQRCTTGDSELDQQIFGKNMVNELSKLVNYKLLSVDPPDNPLTTDGNGKFPPITWKSETHPGTNHRWMAMNYFNPQTSKCDTAGAQQQCTFTFDSVAGKCVSIGWDPKGIVFDSVSLEPIPRVDVRLFVEVDGKYIPATIKNTQSVIQNPYRTLRDGEYEFYVQPGKYKLEINDARYKFVANPKIDPNWSKAYGIAPATIYKPDEVIVQESNEIQFRDVPLEPVGQPYRGNVVLMDEGFQRLDKVNDIMFIEQARFSHPFTKVFVCKNGFAKAHPDKTEVCADPNDPNKLGPDGLAVVDADHLGQFTVEIPLAKVKPQDMPFIIRGRKVPLTNKSQSTGRESLLDKVLSLIPFARVNAQEDTSSEEGLIDPILNYIQGYAYDAGGNLLPGATVGVYFTYSNKAYYETKADNKGFFKIASENLPEMPYVIRYTSNNGATTSTVTTSQFLTQNEDYLTKNDINLFTFADESGKRPVAFPPQNKEGLKTVDFYANRQANLTPQEQDERAEVLSSQANMVLVSLILFILFLLAAGGMFFYIRKKRLQGPPENMPY